MMKADEPLVTGPEPSEGESAADRNLEAILNRGVAATDAEILGPDFTARVVAARPFATWEVRRPAAWKAPASVGAFLLATSMGLFLLPLWRLGPGTAFLLWFQLAVAVVARPVSAAVLGAPLLAEAFGKLGLRVFPLSVWVLGALSLASAALLIRQRKWRGPTRTEG